MTSFIHLSIRYTAALLIVGLGLTPYSSLALSTLEGDGLIIYGQSANTTPQWRTYASSTNTFSAATTTVAGATGLTFVVRTSPTKQEAVAGYVNSAGTLQVMCYNGTSWSNEWTASVGGTGTTRRFDIAYETGSGDALVLYGTNATGTNELAYRTKASSTACGSANWSGATNLDPVRTASTTQWVKMAWDRRSTSTLIAAAWADGNSDLSSMIWDGSTWGNEPSAALETSLEVVTAAQDVDDFDLEYESLSGDLKVIWSNSIGANGTSSVRENNCTGGTSACTWQSTSSTPPTWADDATNLDISANPNTDEMIFGSIGNAGSDLQLGRWSGTTWTNSANSDITAGTPLAGTRLISTGWMISGTTTKSIVIYDDATVTSTVRYFSATSTTFTSSTFISSPLFVSPSKWRDVQIDPFNLNRVMFTMSDNASDLFAKRLLMSSTGTITGTNADGGAALEASLALATSSDFSFAYWRFVPSTITQSGYRWFRNTDSPDLASAVVNPSTSTDSIYGMDLNKADEIIYLAGNTVTAAGDDAWRIERRNAKTSAITYSITSDLGTGNDNPRDLEFVTTEDRIYIAGFDTGPGDREWRIEKREARTGDLVYAVANNPSVGIDVANAIAVDAANDAMYIVGSDSTLGGDNEGWRIEKRSVSDGSLVYATSSNFSTSSEAITSIAIDKDAGYMYVTGSEFLSGTDSRWRTEKRNLSDGSLIFATSTNPSSLIDTPNAIAIGSSSIFIAGRDRAIDNGQWRIERRDATTGALLYATTSNPSGGVDEAVDIEVHENQNRIYVIGEESNAWRIEKRDLGTGALDATFGTSGAVTNDISGSADIPKAAVLDKSDGNLYVAGRDAIPGDGEWRVARYNANNGNTNWGNALAAENTSSTFPAHRSSVRLRMLVHVGTAAAPTSSQTFKLQYAARSGTCDTGFSGETYGDVVTSTGDIRFMSNAGVAGGSAALANFRDPTHGADNVVEETYIDGGTFSNSVAIPAGQDGLWDFVLQNYSASAGNAYCFRIVKSDNSLLDTYSVIPEITTSASLSASADQLFDFEQATTTAGTITIVGSVGTGGAITAANDIRIKIASANVGMEWNTASTTLTLGGTAFNKVSSTASFSSSSTVVLNVTSDFASGDTLTVSGLSLTNFNTANASSSGFELYVDGVSDTDEDDVDDKKVTIRGKLEEDVHPAGQKPNTLDFAPSALMGVELLAFKLTPRGESATTTQLVVDITDSFGFSAGDLTNVQLAVDADGDGTISGGETTTVGGSGNVSLTGQSGSITFSSAFSITSALKLILKADISGIDPGDFLKFRIQPGSITATGRVSVVGLAPSGNTQTVQHGRRSKFFGATPTESGGGGGEPVGGGGEGGGGGGAP